MLSAILPTDLLTWVSYAFGAGVISTLLRYPYGRSLEEEADKVGLQLAAKVSWSYFSFWHTSGVSRGNINHDYSSNIIHPKACFDIRAASAFWGKMDAMENSEDDEKIEWLSTHPSHKVRQKNIEDLLHHANTLRNICQVKYTIVN